MQVSVKDLRPNPFRPDIPFNQAKIKQLEANIRSTDFWDNIVARQTYYGFELAYGHHRLEALKNLKVKEINIPVKKLDDATMLKIMAQENMEEWDQSPIWVMEVVKTAYSFLQKIKQCNVLTGQEVVEFLSWPRARVEDAIANLRSTGEIPQSRDSPDKQPPIKKEIFKELPTQKHASEFRRAVQVTKASPKVQKAVAPIFADKPAQKNEAIYLIEKEQIKQGEKPIVQKSKLQIKGEEFIYISILEKILIQLPTSPPKNFTEEGFQMAKKLASFIIKRLKEFEND